MLQAAALEQGEAEVRGLVVGKRFVRRFLVGIEIRVVRARDECRARGQSQDETIAEVQRPRHVVAGREEHDATGAGGIDGALNGAGIVGLSVTAGAVVADASRGWCTPGVERPRDEAGCGEDPGTTQERPARQIHDRARLLSQPLQELEHRRVHLAGSLLLRPVAAAGQHDRPAQLRDELREIGDELVHAAELHDQVAIAGHVEGGHGDERAGVRRQQLPVAVDVAVPVEAAAEAGACELLRVEVDVRAR